MPTIVVKLFAGRAEEVKREYAKALTEASIAVLGCKPEAVDVIFEEIKRNDWANGGVLWSDRE